MSSVVFCHYWAASARWRFQTVVPCQKKSSCCLIPTVNFSKGVSVSERKTCQNRTICNQSGYVVSLDIFLNLGTSHAISGFYSEADSMFLGVIN